jgi:hypothetical protein
VRRSQSKFSISFIWESTAKLFIFSAIELHEVMIEEIEILGLIGA